jgi:hypothetical protein
VATLRGHVHLKVITVRAQLAADELGVGERVL